MNPSPEHIALPLELFFAQLHAAGFRLDTGRKLRLLKALNHHGAAQIGRFEALHLKYTLAPFVATSLEEQRRFYTFFDAFWNDCIQEAEKWATGDTLSAEHPSVKPEFAPKSGFGKKYRWAILAFTFLLLGGIAAPYLKKWLSPAPPALSSVSIARGFNDFARRDGQRDTIKNATTDIHPDSCRWEVRDAETGALEYSDTALHLDWTASGYGHTKKIVVDAGTRGRDSMLVEIHCANPPQMPAWSAPESPLIQGRTYEFSAAPLEKNARVKWFIKNVNTDTSIQGIKARYTFDQNGQATVECKVYFNEKDCYASELRSFDVGADKPILPLADLQYENPRTESRLKTWVWLLFLLPLLPTAWMLWRWWRKRREKPAITSDEALAAQYPLHDKAPYFIPYRPQDGKISVPPDFYRMAEVLRRREHSERLEVDVPASVRATVDSGGYPTLLDKRDTTPPDYLFLLERPSAHDQQGRLFERLTTFLRKQDAPLTVFFHDGNFLRFWSEEKPEGVSFDYLHRQYGGYRLVLIGTGHGLYNPYDTRLPALYGDKLDALLFWKKALFLSTLPPSAWQVQEVLLHRHFLLYPADTAGILAGLEALDALEEHEPGPYSKWEETLARQRNEANPRIQRWETVEQHRAFFTSKSPASNVQQSNIFHWLCGLAVSVLPDFALTVAIGKKMGIEVTHDGLLLLSRIPWLNRNEPRAGLRLALLAELSPEAERLAREAVAEELEAVRADTLGGYAELDWKTSLAIHRFALEPENPEHRQTLRELMQLGLLSEGQLQELDGLVDRRLSGKGGKKTGGDSTAPAGTRFAEYLDKKPFFTKTMRWALMLAGLSLGLLGWGWWQQRQTEPPVAAFVRQETVLDSALIWHNEAVRMALKIRAEKDYSVWNGMLQDTARVADSLFTRSTKYWGLDPVFGKISPSSYQPQNIWNLPFYNQANFNYNLAAQRFNFFQSQTTFTDAATLAVYKKFRLAEGRLTELMVIDSLFQNLPNLAVKSVEIDALHGHGICQFYFYRYAWLSGSLDSAKFAYDRLLLATDSLYFDTIRARMPVNLQTLLISEGSVKEKSNIKVSDQKKEPLSDQIPNLVEVSWPNDTALTLKDLYPKSIWFTKSNGNDTKRDTINRDGSDGSKKGFVRWLRTVLEDNSTREVLETHPKWIDNGSISGFFPIIRALPRNLKFKATIGFMKPAGLPQSDGASFKVIAHVNGIQGLSNVLLNTYKTYDSKLQDVTIDLSRYAGKRISIELRVDAGGSSVQDWAAWVNPRLVQEVQDMKTFLADIGSSMIFIQGGSFRMGSEDSDKDASDDEKPAREVTMADYYLGRTEVTNAQYANFLNDYKSDKVKTGEYKGQEMIYEYKWGIQFPDRGRTGYRPQQGYENHPVVYVTWYGATEYCRWLSAKTGQNYRLPSEAEWEYAARGGVSWKDGYRFSGSNDIEEVAWYDKNSYDKGSNSPDYGTHPVARKKPNQRGLYDMSGNVWEWCQDPWHENYQNAPPDGRVWTDGGDADGAVLRGGSWYDFGDACRPANRVRFGRNNRNYDNGFRLARAAPAGGK